MVTWTARAVTLVARVMTPAASAVTPAARAVTLPARAVALHARAVTLPAVITALPGGLLAVSPPGPSIGRQAAQRLARQELARPQYHQRSLWQLVLELLRRLLNRTSAPALPGGSWAPIVLAVLAVALAAGVLLWTRSLTRSRRAAPRPAVSAGGRSAREHHAAAQQLAAAGDYTRASLECVRAIAAELQERQVLPPRPGRTADEFAAEAGGALPAEAGALRAAAAVFDAICYGKRAGSAAGYQQLAGLAARIGVGTGRGRALTAGRGQGALARGAG